MKQNGKPVTDLEQYIKDNNIPVYFHEYCKLTMNPKNPDGIWQEDIKRLPNSHLAESNALENYAGVQSYIEHLGKFLDQVANNAPDTVQCLLDSLRAIHVNWYNRNSSWTVP